jgi:hypothetical protein
VFAAIAPTAAVSVRPIAPAAAIADLLGSMATSFVFASGSSVGFAVLGTVGPVWRRACKGPVGKW